MDSLEALQYINDAQHVTTEELCAKFSVSESTARRVLWKLSERGLIERYHGGAFSLRTEDTRVMSRMQENQEKKDRIAKAAAGLIPDGSTLLLLGGTTVKATCAYLKKKKSLTVITTNMLAFEELKNAPNIDLILLGGVYNRQEAELSGVLVDIGISHMRADYLLMSAFSFDEKHGFVVAKLLNEFYLGCMESSDKICILVDSSKYRNGGTTITAPPEKVDFLFTDEGLPEEARQRFTELGVKVVIAD